MSSVILWIAAEAERTEGSDFTQRTENVIRSDEAGASRAIPIHDLPAHQFPARENENAHVVQKMRNMGTPANLSAHQLPVTSPSFAKTAKDGAASAEGIAGTVATRYRNEEFRDRELERRTYRGRTVAMLRRYMRYSIETGRLPSLLGREFFRAKVTSYSVVTFEDRVIFVHDMESCLERLDEFSQQLIARHILQEHDRWATAKLLHCNEKTVRRLTPLALDQLSEILLDMGLMERMESMEKNSCQEGSESRNSASDWEEDK
jgi:DNA-directed RNA polymerase specialized sigma24 family protein